MFNRSLKLKLQFTVAFRFVLFEYGNHEVVDNILKIPVVFSNSEKKNTIYQMVRLITDIHLLKKKYFHRFGICLAAALQLNRPRTFSEILNYEITHSIVFSSISYFYKHKINI